jgi:hypothetical protein
MVSDLWVYSMPYMRRRVERTERRTRRPTARRAGEEALSGSPRTLRITRCKPQTLTAQTERSVVRSSSFRISCAAPRAYGAARRLDARTAIAVLVAAFLLKGIATCMGLSPTSAERRPTAWADRLGLDAMRAEGRVGALGAIALPGDETDSSSGVLAPKPDERLARGARPVHWHLRQRRALRGH